MRKERQVISYNNLPRKWPVISTLTVILALDHWHAAKWVWTAICTLLGMIWAVYLLNWAIHNDIEVDLFEKEDQP